MKKNLLLTLTAGVLAALSSCSKQNLTETQNAKAEERFVNLSTVLFPGFTAAGPNYGLDFYFDNNYSLTQTVSNFQITVPEVTTAGAKNVLCTTKKNSSGYPDFSAATSTSVTFTAAGVGTVGCSVDLTQIPATLLGGVEIFLDIAGVDRDYRILAYKKTEFSNPISAAFAYTTAALSVTRTSLLNPNNNTVVPLTKVVTATGIGAADTYTLVYQIVDNATNHGQSGSITGLTGTALAAATYNLNLNLYGFRNAGSLAVRMYLINTNASPAASIFKTLSIQPVTITIT